jgi:DNA-binding PadR family transcriptional regulator
MAEYLGEFEHLLLLAIVRLGEDAHGATIRATLKERAGRDVSFGSIYSTIRRLEEKGLVTSTLGDPSPTRGGRAKKELELTAAGRSALKETQRAIGRMAEGLKAL